jgi:hypothetical protein
MVRDFNRILGLPLEHPEVQMVIGSLGGHLTADALDAEFSVEIPDRGIAFKFDDKRRLSSVFLEGPSSGTSAAYADELPDGLSFSMSRQEVRTALGAPTKSGGGTTSAVFNRVTPRWDRFDRRDSSLHVQYNADANAIAMVTLIATWRVPK